MTSQITLRDALLLVTTRRERDEARANAARLREDLMRCGSLAVSDRLDGSLGKRRADRITEIVWAACWPETKR